MDEIFKIRTAQGEQLMAAGHKGNVRAYFEQNGYEGEVRRFQEAGVTIIIAADVREENRP